MRELKRSSRGLALTCVAVVCLVAGTPALEAKDKHVEGAGGVYSLELPKRWRAANVPTNGRTLGLYDGWFGIPVDEPEVSLAVIHSPGFSRASLAHDVLHGAFGEPVPDTLTRSEGRVTSCRIIADGAVWRTFVEHEGEVFYAETGMHPDMLDRYGKRIGGVVGSLVIVKLPDPPTPPGKLVRHVEGPFELWAPKKKNKAYGRALAALREGWDHMQTVVPGDPAMTSPPIVVLYPDDATYEAQKGGTHMSDFAFVGIYDGRLHVRLRAVKGKAYVEKLHEQGARLRLHRFFGGPCPRWLEDGLAAYTLAALAADGDGAKPRSVHRNKARPYVARDAITWADHLTATRAEGDDLEAIRYTLWAWHWYFRHGPGRDEHGARYDETLKFMRETGSAAQARSAWKGVDQDALLAAFKKWAKGW